MVPEGNHKAVGPLAALATTVIEDVSLERGRRLEVQPIFRRSLFD
jgi:hypothetical protein